MIYTLTTNPAIDYNLTTSSVDANAVNRTTDAVYSPNGKGLNVSFVLKHFGLDSKILGFFGGFSGDFIVNESRKAGFEVIDVKVDDITRINVFINHGKDEYKYVNAGPLIIREKQLEMLEIIKKADDMDYLVISGSLPTGIENDYYDEILEICKLKKVEVIIDISSVKLKELLKYKPFLIKPNDEEVEAIFGWKINDESDAVDALDKLTGLGCQNVLLTLGDKGSYFSNGKDIYFANTQEVELLSSACAGDSALAGFLSLFIENQSDIENALKRSSATGANVAESPGIGNLEKVETYSKNIIVRKVR